MLRVLHELAGPVAGLAAEVARLRDEPGCVSAELYATLAAGEEQHALTLLFDTEEQYWSAWDRLLRGAHPALLDAVRSAPVSEFYDRTPFALRSGTWVPEAADEAARRIFWPARGEVRIIITNAVEASPAMYGKIRAEIAETRREQGCVSYAWYESTDLTGHLMLLEVWADQVVYDRHWALRVATAPYVGDNLRRPAEPLRGLASREFYRRQQFRAHYDRWLPADASAHATAITYPAT